MFFTGFTRDYFVQHVEQKSWFLRQSIQFWHLSLFALLCCGYMVTAQADSIDDFVETQRVEQKIPGLSIGIFRQGRPVRLQGYGLANIEHGVRVHPDTIFQSGSIGKMFTAMAVMLLVEEGKLDLDKSIRHYLPDAPKSWQAISPRHLLNHTGGLGYPKLNWQQEYSEDQLLQQYYATKLEFPAGRRYSYSNVGYVTLGIIVHKLSGQFYGDFLSNRVFKPLGMNSARVISDQDIVINRASGYEMTDEGPKNQSWVSVSLNATADGSLYLSMLDYAKWDAAVHRRALLKPESWQQILSPALLDNGTSYPYGFGWELEKTADGGSIIAHDGAWQGFQTALRRYDTDGISFVVLANSDNADTETILQGIAQRFDKRYSKIEQTLPIADMRIDLTKRVETLLKKLKNNNLTKHDLPDSFIKRGSDYQKKITKQLNEAGICQPLLLYKHELNGDQQSRSYQLNCVKKEFYLFVMFGENDRIKRFWLRPKEAKKGL